MIFQIDRMPGRFEDIAIIIFAVTVQAVRFLGDDAPGAIVIPYSGKEAVGSRQKKGFPAFVAKGMGSW